MRLTRALRGWKRRSAYAYDFAYVVPGTVVSDTSTVSSTINNRIVDTNLCMLRDTSAANFPFGVCLASY